MSRHPTIEECERAGNGYGIFTPDTPAERHRFEAYMRAHSWDYGAYDKKSKCYAHVSVRMLYGVWRDRGALPTVWEEKK
jgi:hypothetical protein